MDPIVWAAILLVLGLTLVVAEVFLPSGGILGFLSLSALVSAVSLAFYYRGLEAGFLFLTVTAVLVPGALALAFRWWPHTPMGRRLLLDVPRGEDLLPDSPQRRTLRQLVGKLGVAKTVMLPSGAIIVDGQTIDARSEGMPIEAGQHVRVIEVRGNRVVVQPADDAPPPADDLLSRPIESLGLDALDDPLA
ncbi:MAG TPA: NfeD family protein [Pirellulales bacterium]|jgi:membrane-bound serine protease (ClpP class)|nr:NfeD family protein [Pirellulales bacterium]